MPSLKPYPSYRNTDLPWLGQIPAHWEAKRLKFIAPASTNKLTDKPDDLSYVGLENIESGTGRLLMDTQPETVESNVGVFNKGDILFGKLRPYLAKVAEADFRGSCTTEILALKPLNIHSRYLFYSLLSPRFIEFVNSMTYGTKMPRASWEQIGNMPISLPTFEEQQTIAAYLDRQTAKVDALIARKQRLLDLLAEQRAALISQAVTKGVPKSSEVSETSEVYALKNSGVAWLGQVPSHWEVSKLGYVSVSLQTGPFGSQIHSSEYVSGGIPLINPAHIKDGKIYPSEETAVDEETWKKLSRHELLEGDIVFARRGEMGRCALVTKVESGWLCGTGSIRVRPTKTLVFPEYLSWVLSTKGISDWLLLESVGTTMDNLNTKILAAIPLPVPPIKEQKEIVDYLDHQTKRLTDLVTKIETAIERLHEYRAALISSVVTGKVRV